MEEEAWSQCPCLPTFYRRPLQTCPVPGSWSQNPHAIHELRSIRPDRNHHHPDRSQIVCLISPVNQQTRPQKSYPNLVSQTVDCFWTWHKNSLLRSLLTWSLDNTPTPCAGDAPAVVLPSVAIRYPGYPIQSSEKGCGRFGICTFIFF